MAQLLPYNNVPAHVAAGRADYYGALPNLAARVSALAAPGQVLIEGSGGWSGDPDWGTSQDGGLVESKPSQAGWLPIARTLSKTPTDEEPIELEQQGYFLLKVRNPSAARSGLFSINL